jgi:CO dehydrogenase maturation factor
MTYSIALAGKGGTGKTTVAGMLVRYLVQREKTPVLAVDADANANLNEVLGLTLRATLGEAREEMKKGVAAGMTKDVFMQMKIQEAVVEAKGFDLIVMGRPEGTGCYCAANSLLTQYLDKLMVNYASVVIDNEAGMEHLSRMTTNNMDALLVVSDPTKRGLQAAARILELTRELKLNIGRNFLLVNQAKDSQVSSIESFIKGYNMDLLGVIPEDPKVREFDLKGIATIELDEGSTALRAAYDAFDKIMS